MQAQEFIASLTTAERRSLTARTNAQAVLRGSILIALIILSSAWIQFGGWQWLATLTQGLLLISLFHLLHECIHFTAFKSKSVNQCVAFICGLVLFLPPTWFRYFHLAHHRHTQIPDKDPELTSAKPNSVTQWLVHVSGFHIWRDSLALFVRSMHKPINDDFIPASKLNQTQTEIQVMCFIYFAAALISLLTGSLFIIWLWLAPILIGQPFLRVYLLAEHGQCPEVPNMFRNTRTVFTNPAVRWFSWNMPYHTEHHVYPTVPFHRLPDLHTRMQQHLQNTATGYLAFNQHYLSNSIDRG